MKLAILLLIPTEMYTIKLHLTAEKEVNSFRGIVWNQEYRLWRSDEVIFNGIAGLWFQKWGNKASKCDIRLLKKKSK